MFRGIKKAINGENPFAFPGSAASASGGGAGAKFNPLPKTSVIPGTGTVTGESGYASGNRTTTSGFSVPDGVTGATSKAVAEGMNTRKQIGSNMSTEEKIVAGVAAGFILNKIL